MSKYVIPFAFCLSITLGIILAWFVDLLPKEGAIIWGLGGMFFCTLAVYNYAKFVQARKSEVNKDA